MKVVIVAAPLIMTGGVYQSTNELVETARNLELDWSSIIVMRSSEGPGNFTTGNHVHCVANRGVLGLVEMRKLLETNDLIQSADALISMIPQTDVLFSTLPRRNNQVRIGYVRGAPWPNRGETNSIKRAAWKTLETWALKRMDQVWTTTELMRDEFRWPSAEIIPAGVANIENTIKTNHQGTDVVWAGRMSQEKNPHLFLEIMENCNAHGVMYGDGELRQNLSMTAPTNVDLPGWSNSHALWNNAAVFLGTSYREAFGRSAVEAAARGIPVILTNAFGAAPLIYTDPNLRQQFVLDASDTSRWIATLTNLLSDDRLRNEVSSHVRQNALKLTMLSSVKAIDEQLKILIRSSNDASKAENR